MIALLLFVKYSFSLSASVSKTRALTVIDHFESDPGRHSRVGLKIFYHQVRVVSLATHLQRLVTPQRDVILGLPESELHARYPGNVVTGVIVDGEMPESLVEKELTDLN